MECGAKGAGWESVFLPLHPTTLKHSHRAEIDLQPLQAFFLILLRTEYRSAYLSNKKIQKLVLGS